MIPGTKSSLYVEEFFEFSDKLSGPLSIDLATSFCMHPKLAKV